EPRRRAGRASRARRVVRAVVGAAGRGGRARARRRAHVKILLLHALPLDERMWEPQLEALAEYEMEAPNLYALEGSSMEGWAATLLERVPGELVLVGASMGGYLALAVVRLAPERVLGLVLAGSRADADSP